MSTSESSTPVVLHLTGMNSTKYGGLERYLRSVAEQCARLGFRTVLQYETFPQSAEYRRDLAAAGAELVVEALNVRTLISIAALTRLLRQGRPVIVHTHFTNRHVILAAGLLAPLFGARNVVSMVHNFHGFHRGSRGRYAYNRCDLVLAVSEAVRRDLLAGGVSSDKVKTHYLGVFPVARISRTGIRKELGITADEVVLGNISFDAEFKGLDLLLQAVSVLNRAGEKVRLLQIGVDPAKSELPALAEHLGIAERVLWTGIRDNGAEMLNAVDIYVQSSRYGEGLPLSIMEAMSLGLPVVATKVSGNEEAIMHGVNGLVVEPGDPSALAAALHALVTRPGDWSRLGQAGRRRYDELFWAENSVKELVGKCYGFRGARGLGPGLRLESGSDS